MLELGVDFAVQMVLVVVNVLGVVDFYIYVIFHLDWPPKARHWGLLGLRIISVWEYANSALRNDILGVTLLVTLIVTCGNRIVGELALAWLCWATRI